MIDEIAVSYVKLTLNISHHHEYYVDAYYGPQEWLESSSKQPLPTLLKQAEELQAAIEALNPDNIDPLRRHFLQTQIRASLAFIQQLQGVKLSFDTESLAFYDAVSPHFTEEDFDQLLAQLSERLPADETGELSLNQRLNQYRQQFIIPKDKLAAVFDAAINKARELTRQHISLPENEDFRVEYVTDQVWSAYNWYKGNAYSLIEVNTDFPIYIERAIDLASHEGYPGHHVFNSLIEKHLYKEKGWVEYCVYPLFSPLSLLAEGSANYGIEVAFTTDVRMDFEKNVLFPLAGIDPDAADEYYAIQNLLHHLSYVDNMIARRYLDAEINHEEAINLMMTYSLTDREKSTQRLKFIEYNRSYVINYNLGQDLTKAFVEGSIDTNDPLARWKCFADLLQNPRCASLLTLD